MSSLSLEPSACPDENTIAAYVEGRLTGSRVEAMEAHVDACTACRKVTASVVRALGDGATARLVAPSNDDDESAVARLKRDLDARIVPGQSLGRYIVRESLGAGGMGAVYAARDPDLDRDVALKVVSPRGDDAAAQRLRLLREARTAARLQHPNVVAVYDVGEVGESAYLAMELVRGATLRHFVGDASVPVARRVGWLADVARALAAAHEQRLVHRDIKPENVMVRDDGVVKVVDFGIARTHAEQAGGETISRITKTGAIIGTPGYMAPEQLRDDEIDPRTDQFAWGVMAYELLSGDLPWRGDGLTVVAEILTREPPPLRVRGEGGATDGVARVAATIRRAMAKAPAARFASMHEIVSALGHGDPHAMRSRRGRWLALMGALVVAISGATALYASRTARTAGPSIAPDVSATSATAAVVASAAPRQAPPETSLAAATTDPPPPPASSSSRPPRARSATTAKSAALVAPPTASSARVDMLDLRK